MENYNIEVFSRSDYEKYKTLVNVSQDITDQTKDRRKWYCFDNKLGGAFAAAFYGNKVAATCYLSGKLLQLNGKEYKAYEIGETSTSPEHQRKGLFSKLVNACSSYAFKNDAAIVYGTPNAQSTPGYAKLQFRIMQRKENNLFFSPFTLSFISSKISKNIELVKCPRYEISPIEYYSVTANQNRSNIFSLEYFQWRFLDSKNSGYRFYRINNFSMAVRDGFLGKYKILIISEYFYDKTNNIKNEHIKCIRSIIESDIDKYSYSGFYFKSQFQPSFSYIKYGFKGLIHHRELPICIKINKDYISDNQVSEISLAQLSDCDIG